MAGNVSEWVADVYRPLTNNEVSDMNYFRGNLFQTYITEDGKASVNNDVINYDDNPNGRSVYSQLPGSIQKQNIVPNDFDSEFSSEDLLNSNGLVANNIAYADGDKLFERDGEEMYTDAFDETRKEKKNVSHLYLIPLESSKVHLGKTVPIGSIQHSDAICLNFWLQTILASDVQCLILEVQVKTVNHGVFRKTKHTIL